MPTGQFARSTQHKTNIARALKGRSHPWSKKEKIKKLCPCGTEFLLIPSKYRKGHGVYCSRSCYYKFRDNGFISRISKARKGKTHYNFKGDKAGYKAFHLRVQQERGKADHCEKDNTHISCEYQWANLTGNYQDPMDYISLCRSCHSRLDQVGKKRAETLGEEGLSISAKRGWETRRRKVVVLGNS